MSTNETWPMILSEAQNRLSPFQNPLYASKRSNIMRIWIILQIVTKVDSSVTITVVVTTNTYVSSPRMPEEIECVVMDLPFEYAA